MLFPVPIKPLPQLPVYHLQRANEPREPPLTLRVTEVPPHVESAEEMMETGVTLGVFTFMVLVTHTVVLQVPSALTKYCVVAVGVTDSVGPVPTNVPPQLPMYHLQRALEPSVPVVICMVTWLLPQVESLFVIMEEAAMDGILTLMVLLTIPVTLQVPSARTL
jgi:hypothetical protein